MSQQIQRLEDACGRALLVRSSRGVAPTPAGETLLTYAGRVENLLEDADAALRAPGHAGGELDLAASTTSRRTSFRASCVRFRAREPASAIRLAVANTEGIHRARTRRRHPLGLIEGRGARSPRAHRAVRRRRDVPCVAAATEKLTFPVPRTLAELALAPLVLRERGSGTREVVERALRRAAAGHRRRRPSELELGSTEACKAAVEAGLAVGFLSRVTIEKELALGTLRPIEIRRLRIARTFRWAMASSAAPQGVAGRFYRFAAGFRP